MKIVILYGGKKELRKEIEHNPKFNKKALLAFEAIKNGAYKQKEDFCIFAYQGNKKVAILRPLTKKHLINNKKNREIIKLLTQWRDAANKWFPAVFRVTQAGTKRWLKKHLIEKKDRILFIIETLDGIPFGHVGLYRGEADNYIRGQKNVLKGGMTFAAKAMLKWAFSELNLPELYLRAFSDNQRAIILDKRCGFKEVGKIPLYGIKENNSIVWQEIKINEQIKPERFFSLMYQKNPYLYK